MIDKIRRIGRNLTRLLGKDVNIHDKRDFLIDSEMLVYVPKGSKERASGFYVNKTYFVTAEVDRVHIRSDRKEGIVYLNISMAPAETAV